MFHGSIRGLDLDGVRRLAQAIAIGHSNHWRLASLRQGRPFEAVPLGARSIAPSGSTANRGDTTNCIRLVFQEFVKFSGSDRLRFYSARAVCGCVYAHRRVLCSVAQSRLGVWEIRPRSSNSIGILSPFTNQCRHAAFTPHVIWRSYLNSSSAASSNKSWLFWPAAAVARIRDATAVWFEGVRS